MFSGCFRNCWSYHRVEFFFYIVNTSHAQKKKDFPKRSTEHLAIEAKKTYTSSNTNRKYSPNTPRLLNHTQEHGGEGWGVKRQEEQQKINQPTRELFRSDVTWMGRQRRVTQSRSISMTKYTKQKLVGKRYRITRYFYQTPINYQYRWLECNPNSQI